MSDDKNEAGVEVMGKSVETRTTDDHNLIWFLLCIVCLSLGLALGGWLA